MKRRKAEDGREKSENREALKIINNKNWSRTQHPKPSTNKGKAFYWWKQLELAKKI